LCIVGCFFGSPNEAEEVHLSLIACNELEHLLLGIIIKNETCIKGMGIYHEGYKNEKCDVE